MGTTMLAQDLTTLQPGSDVYGPSGNRMGVVLQLSGDRFLLATNHRAVWVPYDWITAAHPRALAVNFTAADLDRFERAGSSRWSRRRVA